MGEGFAESFDGRFRDEFHNTKLFTTAPEAQILADRWRWKYNTLCPHSALQGHTPPEAAQQGVPQTTPTHSHKPWTGKGGHVTTVTRTAFTSMSTMGSSADMLSLLPISTTARCFRSCLIQKKNMTMSGQTQHNPANALLIF
jgi:hypothetical protein